MSDKKQKNKKTVKLGSRVTYYGNDGHSKLAFVVATQDSVDPGTSLQPVGKNEAHLVVFSPSGKTYHRTSVSQATATKDQETPFFELT